MTGRDDLLAKLADHMEAEDGTAGPQGVHAPGAERVAEWLLAHLATADGLDADVQYTVGTFYWLRVLCAPSPARDEEDWTRAVVLLMPLYLGAPEKLPDAVRASFAEAIGELGRDRAAHARAESLADLALFLTRRFLRHGEQAAGSAAAGLLREAAGGLPADHPRRAQVLTSLGHTLMLTGATAPAADGAPPVEATDEAVGAFREALGATPRDHPARARRAGGLGAALRVKAAVTGDRALLAEAVDLLREAAAAARAGAELAQIHADLGSALLTRADSGPDEPGQAAALLDESVASLTASVRHTPALAPDRPARQRLLAAAHQARYARLGERSDLLRAAEALRELLAATRRGHPDRPALAGDYGSVLAEAGYRGLRLGAGHDQDPLRLLRQALADLPAGSQERERLSLALRAVERRTSRLAGSKPARVAPWDAEAVDAAWERIVAAEHAPPEEDSLEGPSAFWPWTAES